MQVRRWFEDLLRRKRIGMARNPGRHCGRPRYSISSLEARDCNLRAHTLEAAFHGVANSVLDLGEARSASVGICPSPNPCAAAEQLIDWHTGAFPLNVPKR